MGDMMDMIGYDGGIKEGRTINGIFGSDKAMKVEFHKFLEFEGILL